MQGGARLKFGTNMRLQRHTDVRGSVQGKRRPVRALRLASDNTVDPATFGIPSNIQTANDRPALQSNINFLLGRVGRITQGFVQQGNGYAPAGTIFDFDAPFDEIDFYAQDTWKPRSNVTVDAGLRWEAKLAPRNPDNLILRCRTSASRWHAGRNDAPLGGRASLYKDDWNNFAPSLGVAWDPTGRREAASSAATTAWHSTASTRSCCRRPSSRASPDYDPGRQHVVRPGRRPPPATDCRTSAPTVVARRTSCSRRPRAALIRVSTPNSRRP